MSQVDIQEKIAAARREAEGLKEKIRSKRDQTADTSRESQVLLLVCAWTGWKEGGRGARQALEEGDPGTRHERVLAHPSLTCPGNQLSLRGLHGTL